MLISEEFLIQKNPLNGLAGFGIKIYPISKTEPLSEQFFIIRYYWDLPNLRIEPLAPY